MTDWHRRTLAPLTPEAWNEVDSTARRILTSQLSARRLVDFDGPHQPLMGAANSGRLEISKTEGPGGVPWGLRKVEPLVELRIPFVVNQMELDNITRGCRNPDLSALEKAAGKLVRFEETAIYHGFEAGGIQGITPSSSHDAVPLPSDAGALTQSVAEGVRTLRVSGIGGPYALVLGGEPFFALMQAGTTGYPPIRIIRNTLGGEVLWSPALQGGVLLSTRGGDFELVVGEDISIGYAMHDRDKVELYLAESFTFRVHEPAAALALQSA